MARAQTDTRRLVRAMDEIAWPLEIEGVTTQWVVGARTDDPVELLAVLAMFLDHGDRNGPFRILLPPHDLGDTLGRGPAHLADSDRMRDDDLRLTDLVRREVEQPHRSDVDDHALVRGVRKNELRRQNDPLVGTRKPRIDTGVGAHDLLVAHVEAAGDVGKRVLLGGAGRLHRTDDVLLREELELFRLHRRRHQRRGRRCGRRRLVLCRMQQTACGDRQQQA